VTVPDRLLLEISVPRGVSGLLSFHRSAYLNFEPPLADRRDSISPESGAIRATECNAARGPHPVLTGQAA